MKKGSKGITLIALVITIIVLLILAGVTIITLTGENGLITKASNVKNTNLEAEIEEEIRLAWNKVYADSYIKNLSEEQKADALQAELIEKDSTATVNVNGNKFKISYRGYNKVLDMTNGTLSNPTTTAAKAKETQEKFDENTRLIDAYGNTFIVPKGFKLANDSAEKVTEGIVIEDAEYTNTIGSQFVWIPVGIKKKSNENEIIELNRYGFSWNEESGTPTTCPENFYEEDLQNRIYNFGNTVSENINDFISKTNSAGGFWIGRYEARTVIKRNDNNKNTLTHATEKVSDYVYTFVTQPQAASLSQEMYTSNNYFESDLINSYAWDTAVLFLQEYDNRTGNDLSKYSLQARTDTEFLDKGSTSDKICNVYDIANNCYEWTTETYVSMWGEPGGAPCVSRGASWIYYGGCSAGRNSSGVSSFGIYDGLDTSFRPIIYIK